MRESNDAFTHTKKMENKNWNEKIKRITTTEKRRSHKHTHNNNNKHSEHGKRLKIIFKDCYTDALNIVFGLLMYVCVFALCSSFFVRIVVGTSVSCHADKNIARLIYPKPFILIVYLDGWWWCCPLCVYLYFHSNKNVCNIFRSMCSV